MLFGRLFRQTEDTRILFVIKAKGKSSKYKPYSAILHVFFARCVHNRHEIISCNTLDIMLLYKSCKNHCPGFGHSAQSLAAGNINRNAIAYGINTGGNYD